MDTEIDWHHEIDGAVGRAPDRPVGELLTTGRRAVRRRRLASATAGLVAATMIGGATWAITPGSFDGTGESMVAGQPPALSESTNPTQASDALPPDEWVRLAPDGEVVPNHPSVEIVQLKIALPDRTGSDDRDGHADRFSPSQDYEGLVHLRVDGVDQVLYFWKTGSDLGVVPEDRELRALTDFQQWTEFPSKNEKDAR